VRVPVLAVAAVIAGCGSPGLQLEVGVGDTGVTRIELIVGAPCESCPAMMAAPGVALRDASIYSSPHPDAWFADVDSAFAGFFLHVDGDSDQRIPVLVLVGYDSANHPIQYAMKQDIVVPSADEQYWRIKLKPITRIDDSVPATDSERLAVWRHPDQREPSCAMIEHSSDSGVTTRAIVPPTDPDCDHVQLAECSPYVPNAQDVRSSLGQSDCVLIQPTPSAPVCMMGGPNCTDGVPMTASTCGRLDEDYCLPSSMCECAPRDALCIGRKFLMGTNDGTVTTFRCSVPITETGTVCPGGATTVLDGRDLLAIGTNCTSIRFLDQFFAGPVLGDTLAFETATLALSGFGNGCTVQIGLLGSLPNPASTHTTFTMVDLAVDTGQHIALPLRVSTVTDCTQPFKCALVQASTNDAVYLCGRPML
jgi:hypothetical protein